LNYWFTLTLFTNAFVIIESFDIIIWKEHQFLCRKTFILYIFFKSRGLVLWIRSAIGLPCLSVGLSVTSQNTHSQSLENSGGAKKMGVQKKMLNSFLAAVLLSASVERFCVSRMRIFKA
jgi:hypothetical protein